MPAKLLVLGWALLCLAWVEPSFAQSMRCIEFCRNVRGGDRDALGYNMCLHKAPICTGQPFDAVARGPAGNPMASGPTAAQRAACGGDVQKFCQGIQRGGGRLWACLATRKNELSPACKEMVARQGL
jgi:hypothetical protein